MVLLCRPRHAELTRAVFAAHSSVLRHGDRANGAFGQSSARWRAMFNIAHGNGTVSGIAGETDYARQSIQRLADALVADGLATYAPDPKDRRIQVITLTAEGNTLLAEMEAEFERWSNRLVYKLGKENVLQTIEHLRELKDVLDADADTEHPQSGKAATYRDLAQYRLAVSERQSLKAWPGHSTVPDAGLRPWRLLKRQLST